MSRRHLPRADEPNLPASYNLGVPLKTTNLKGCRCVIAALVSAKDKQAPSRLGALRALVESLGGSVVGTVVQRRGVSRASKPGGVKQLNAPMNAATVLGAGKVEELAALAGSTGANTVIFLNALSASQVARLGELTGCRVLQAPPEIGEE
jgi:50S ribosomal subunit-associated GTPase HflX